MRGERDKAVLEWRHARRELLEYKRSERGELDALVSERDALATGMEQRSMETSTLTEALRQREASEVRAAGLGPAGGTLR